MTQKERRPSGDRAGTPNEPFDVDVPRLFAAAMRHHRAGNLAEAARGYRSVLAGAPQHDQSLYLLGVVALQQGEPQQAIEHINKALVINEQVPEWHYNLACAYQSVGRLNEAVTHYRWALTLHPGAFDVMSNLTHALILLGETGPAIATAMRALRLNPSPQAKRLVVTTLIGLRQVPVTEELRAVVLRALTEMWGDFNDLTRVASALLDPVITAMVTRAASVWPQRLAAEEFLASYRLAAIARDQIFRCMLERAPSRNHKLEYLLTSLRGAILVWAERGSLSGAQADHALEIGCSLAQQCFINEYVYGCADDESRSADRLQADVLRALEAGAPIPPLMVAALAAYRPLHRIPGAASLLQRELPAPLRRVLVQQVQEPLQEAEIARSIPCLTSIDDAVSADVQKQYEENPYPRWTIAAPPAGGPANIDGYLRALFPSAPLRALGRTERLDVLVAGCGTGQHPILTARQFAGAQVLAIDLSRSSLAYARRKSEEIGLAQIEYAQADILRLGKLGRNFDLIEAFGVLHHMADPMVGWRTLLPLLRSGGVMNIGLYSELGRRDVAQAQAYICERGYGRTADDIRRVRQELLALDDADPLKAITARFDFFATSNCRDLMFHVQEHRLTLPAIKSFLADNGLQFLGFALGATERAAYAARFPDDPAMTDLDRWHTFETENPTTFAAMYRFWVQKLPAASGRITPP